MNSFRDFEVLCNNYLLVNFKKDGLIFKLNGGSDSTAEDTEVLYNGRSLFNIEIKEESAQCGQFVLIPNDNSRSFAFSLENKSEKNEYTEAIIRHMNSRYSDFRDAGTSGKKIAVDKKVLSSWIIEYYKNKNVEFFISKFNTRSSGQFVIIPINRLGDYFDISATYRTKRSGSRSLPKKDISLVEAYFKSLYQFAQFITRDEKTYVWNLEYSGSPRIEIGNNKYYLNDSDAGMYEIRKLSNTENMNVIFSIKLTKEQDENDIILFKEALGII